MVQGQWSSDAVGKALCIDDTHSRLSAVNNLGEAVVYLDLTGKDCRGAAYTIRLPRKFSMCAIGHVQKLIWGLLSIVGNVRYGKSNKTLSVPIMIQCTHGVSRTPVLYHNVRQMVQMYNDKLHVYTPYDTHDPELKWVKIMLNKPMTVTNIEKESVVFGRFKCAALALHLARRGTPVQYADLGAVTGHGSAITLPEYGMKLSFWADVLNISDVTSHIWYDRVVHRPGAVSTILTRLSNGANVCELLATLNQDTSRDWVRKTMTEHERDAGPLCYTQDYFFTGKIES